MKLGIVIYSDDSETVWNAFRLGNFALNEGDEVKVFLLARGMCLKIRQSEGSEMCPLSTMKDLYDVISGSDNVVTF
ncbi:uncharacterized protein involved in oxidation of intracellular sulfur [Methanophagales archaeon]|nr:uncharacterized protein involved in oxidation of intracellular sulfur [Methanophagales archaeon]